MKETPKYVTIDELAEHLKVPKSWIYGQTRLTGENKFPVFRCGKYMRFELPLVEEWIAKRWNNQP